MLFLPHVPNPMLLTPCFWPHASNPVLLPYTYPGAPHLRPQGLGARSLRGRWVAGWVAGWLGAPVLCEPGPSSLGCRALVMSPHMRWKGCSRPRAHRPTNPPTRPHLSPPLPPCLHRRPHHGWRCAAGREPEGAEPQQPHRGRPRRLRPPGGGPASLAPLPFFLSSCLSSFLPFIRSVTVTSHPHPIPPCAAASQSCNHAMPPPERINPLPPPPWLCPPPPTHSPTCHAHRHPCPPRPTPARHPCSVPCGRTPPSWRGWG